MDETLKRLLEAEQLAQRSVADAKSASEATVTQALADAREHESKFTTRVPEIQEAYLNKARERADQWIGELRRRFDEHNRSLRDLAERHEDDAVLAVIELVTTPGDKS